MTDTVRIGSLFSGAGGLDLAVANIFGGEVVWHSEIDKAASKVLAHHWPDVPNLGDVTQIDFRDVEKVDVLCGGFPCQDVSAAGKRAGIKAGTRSGLWALFANAIDVVRPRLVVIENVRGLLSARAHRNLEPADGAVGDGSDGPVLRAAGAVLGDLADLGYDAIWATVAAADVGAPHRRERVFILASHADANQGGRRGWWQASGGDVGRHNKVNGRRRSIQTEGRSGLAANSPRNGRDEGRPEPARQQGGFDAAVSGDEPGLIECVWCRRLIQAGTETSHPCVGEKAAMLPTPRATDGTDGPVTNCPSVQAICDGSAGRAPRLSEMAAGYLLPTPTTQDGANCAGPSQFQRNTLPLNAEVTLLPTPISSDCHAGKRPDGRTGGDYLNTIIEILLPTPSASDSTGGGANPETREAGGHHVKLCDEALANASRWGKYAPAIARWEAIVGPAPAPTEPNKNGNPRLSAAFSEWIMGWPAGWVTDPAIGISRNDQLRIIGNGVCPQQAVHALRFLLSVAAGTHTHTHTHTHTQRQRADMTGLLPTPKAHDGVFGTPRTSGRPIEKSTHLQTIVSLIGNKGDQ